MNNEQLRTAVYTILTVVAVSAAAARVCNAELVFEPSMHREKGDKSPGAPPRDWPEKRPNPMPTYSSNDRSRWCAVRALVDHGTWAIGQRTEFGREIPFVGSYVDEGIVFEDGWKSIDKVLKPADESEKTSRVRKYYSSKPPLLTFAVAGEYWILKNLFGWSITRDSSLVIKTIILTFNVVPLIVYLWMLRRLIESLGSTDWGRMFVFASACFGTFVTTFITTLNNHTLAAMTTLAAIYPLLRLSANEAFSTRSIAQIGFFAGLTFCLELPAAAFAGILFLVLLWKAPLRTLAIGLPLSLAPLAVQVVLNYIAVGEWEPTYSKFGGPWYEYPGSHWLPPAPGQIKHGIDWARMHESRQMYTFHVMIGHHGLLSLTPIWFLAFAGMREIARPRRWFGPVVYALSMIVIGFYLVKSDNYGGWTSGLRWLIWLTPLWLLTMLPMVDRWADSKWGRRLSYAFLAVSVFSASFPAWNPWRHPWIYYFLESRGWISY